MISDVVNPVVVPHVGREMNPLNGGTTPYAAFRPATGVGVEFW